MQTIEEIFGAAIRRHREKRQLSQEDFADQAGIHRTYVSSIELGKVAVSIAIAQKLAVALGTPLSKLWRDVEKSLPPAE
jgi:transcriptional regulator with XRE-family HTH domain